ncbi:MAG TPA: biopolymer transporter ExbD [Planctomycetota bacterium]|nr:biopolymer transporter ExbD [Planctomycetota bacterium]
MAGSSNIGEASDNPVGINVVPMVDVIFCLCLFFMCALHFKTLEGRIETWLPKHGNQAEAATLPIIDQIRISLRRDHATGRTIRKVGARNADTDLDFEEALHRYPKGMELTVALDATAEVPWKDAVRVVDLCRRNKFEKVEFVEPWSATTD